MTDRDRFRLLFGPYQAPRFEYGDTLWCEVRGELIACGLSAGRIPWPVGKRHPRASARSLVVTGGLAEATRREAAIAVSHWWGVSQACVGKWRKALGVGLSNEGTHQLRHNYAGEPGVRGGLEKAQAKARDPGRLAKLSAAARGRKHSAEVRRRLSEMGRGKKLSAETRRKISEAQQGRLPPWVTDPWTAEEDDLVRALPPGEVAARTGRATQAVYDRRRHLGVSRRRGFNGSNGEAFDKRRGNV